MKSNFTASQIIFIISFILLYTPAWAGTALKAQLLNPFNKSAWTNLELSIDNDKVRMDFRGPYSHGSLIYDRDTSLLTVVDHIHKIVYQVGSAELAGLKIMGNLAFARMKAQWANATGQAHRDFESAQRDIQALFNGTPVLKAKGVAKDGFTCDEYVTKLEGKSGREVWVTLPDAAGMGLEDFNTCRSLVHLALELFGSGLSEMGADTLSFQQQLDGQALPVDAVLYVRGRVAGTFKVKSISTKSFDPGTFDPPARYQFRGLMDVIK